MFALVLKTEIVEIVESVKSSQAPIVVSATDVGSEFISRALPEANTPEGPELTWMFANKALFAVAEGVTEYPADSVMLVAEEPPKVEPVARKYPPVKLPLPG